MRPLRRDVQMIFQDPYSLAEPAAHHRHDRRRALPAPEVEPEGGVKKEVQRLLELVGLNPEHYNRYPHEFSGGQRQRIGIARALALKPKLVVADEPVSALDVSIQAQVVNLLDDLQHELGLTYVIIAHDLSVVRHVSDRIAVMYLGKIVELADRDVAVRGADAPVHQGADVGGAGAGPEARAAAQSGSGSCSPGDVPSPIAPPSGCRFHTRCWKATEICRTDEPPLLRAQARASRWPATTRRTRGPGPAGHRAAVGGQGGGRGRDSGRNRGRSGGRGGDRGPGPRPGTGPRRARSRAAGPGQTGSRACCVQAARRARSMASTASTRMRSGHSSMSMERGGQSCTGR